MHLRKRHAKPLPWLPVARLATASQPGTPRRRYIAATAYGNAEWVLHATKGWRRFSRREG